MNFLRKNPKLVTVAIVVFAFAMIIPSLSTTMQLYGKYRELTEKVKSHSTTNTMRSKQMRLNTLLSEDAGQSEKTFYALSLSCQTNGVLIREVEPAKTVSLDGVLIQTQRITLEGSFSKLLQSIDAVREQLKTVKISSLKFEVEEKNKITSLVVHITFQYVKLEEEHEKD